MVSVLLTKLVLEYNIAHRRSVQYCVCSSIRLGVTWCTSLYGAPFVTARAARGALFTHAAEPRSIFFWGEFSEQLWLFNGQVEDSIARDFFYPLNGAEHGSQPSLTTSDRELIYVLEVIIEPGNLNPRPLTPQSVTLPTLPGAGSTSEFSILHSVSLCNDLGDSVFDCVTLDLWRAGPMFFIYFTCSLSICLLPFYFFQGVGIVGLWSSGW